MPHIVIVGGGLSGLSIAYRLRQLDPELGITVLEPSDRAGGNIGTEEHKGFRFERGPNGFLDRTPALPNLCHDLGITERLIPASEGARKNRFLYLGGKLRKLPRGPIGLLFSPLLSRRGKWKLLTEPWRKPPAAGETSADESIAQFVTRRCGPEAADIFADALVTGIHGGDPKLLSVAATFPRLPVMEREAGSVIRGFRRAAKRRRDEARQNGKPAPGPQRMWSFREGMQVLTDSLAQSLGKSLRLRTRVTTLSSSASVSSWKVYGEGRDVWSADAVVLACPAYEQASILSEIDESLANEVAAIPYNRIAVVALGYREEDCPNRPDGFGYIAPQNTRRDVLGVQWCSAIFPGRAPAGCVLWRALCGGVHRADLLDRDDDSLVRAVHAELALAMGVKGKPVFVRVVRWSAAIPQYEIGHLDRVARIEAAAAKHPGLFLAGNAYRGVAMGDCAEQGERIAEAVAHYLVNLE